MMCSAAEGKPLALTEAMVCGRPAVVTDVGGNAELIEDGITGFVAESAMRELVGRSSAEEVRIENRGNIEAAVRDLFKREGDRIAAVVIEPVPANHGLLLQRAEFLRALREVTQKHGSLLIFDEVISGFRLARGGVAQLSGIQPDLATFGKGMANGLPLAAVVGAPACDRDPWLEPCFPGGRTSLRRTLLRCSRSHPALAAA